MSAKVYIEEIPSGVTTGTIKARFASFGLVQNVQRSQNGNKAVVTMAGQAAQTAVKSGVTIQGRFFPVRPFKGSDEELQA